MFSCIVKNCQNPSEVLFSAPKDQGELFKWKKILKIQEARKSNFFVCERHFDTQQIVVRKILKPDAIPIANITKEHECRSCKGLNLVETHAVTEELKKFYKDFIGIDILDGFLCPTCFSKISNFQDFKNSTKKLHSEPQSLSTEVKEEPDEEFEQVIQVGDDEYYVVTNPKMSPSTSFSHTCHHCKARFLTFELLDTHILNFHSFACNQCNSKFANKTFLDSHKIVMHQPKSWGVRPLGKETRDCNIKGVLMSFPTKRNLCDVCQTNFESRSDVLEHMRKDHSFKCPQCPSILTTLDFLAKHQQFTHSGKRRKRAY